MPILELPMATLAESVTGAFYRYKKAHLVPSHCYWTETNQLNAVQGMIKQLANQLRHSQEGR